MGSDKAFLRLGETTLLENALTRARALTSLVYVVGARDRFQSFAPVVEDIHTGRGPLGGIHAALSSTRTELNLMLAVDMPFVEIAFLQFLADTALQTEAVVTVPRIAGRWQP